MEHKGVAFDVFRIVTRNMPGWQRYVFRCGALLKVTFDIHMLLLSNARDILKARGISPSLWVVLGRWVRDCFIKPGYYRRAFAHYLSFFKPGFDPWKAGKAQKFAKPWQDYFNARAGIADHA
jgi:predicted metal-dependent hydrolase